MITYSGYNRNEDRFPYYQLTFWHNQRGDERIRIFGEKSDAIDVINYSSKKHRNFMERFDEYINRICEIYSAEARLNDIGISNYQVRDLNTSSMISEKITFLGTLKRYSGGDSPFIDFVNNHLINANVSQIPFSGSTNKVLGVVQRIDDAYTIFKVPSKNQMRELNQIWNTIVKGRKYG